MRVSALPAPSVGEVALYVRTHGIGRAWRKFLAGYVVGREYWYLTIEDLTHWMGARLEPGGLEVRRATVADLPRMRGFMERQHPNTLRAWCRDDHVFYIALANGEAVSYRCVSRTVHAAVASAMRLAPAQIYMVDEFTVPAFRRQGITRRLAVATNPGLLAAGFREVVGIHRTDNQDTIAATRAKDIVTIGRLNRACVGMHTWFTYDAYVAGVEPPLAASVRRREAVPSVVTPATPARAA
jgi:hypothetical protein